MSFVENINLKDIDLRLRQLIKLLEASATVDIRNRQLVTIAALKTSDASSTPTEIAATLPVTVGASAGVSLALGSQVPAVGPPYAATGTQVIQPIAETPVDQRWRVAEDSHISYQLGIRNHLSWT